MNSKKNLKNVNNQVAILFAVFSVAILVTPTVWAGEKQKTENSTITGSGDKYKTTVTQQSKGQISSEDLRQVSLLASQVLVHVNKGEQAIELGNSDSAKAEIKNAEKLIDIVHKLLPANLITTTVQDAKGNEVYKNTETTQDDVVPLYQDVETVDIFNDILNAKKAQLKGEELIGTININATMVADLGYIERKVQHAMQLLDDNKSDEAREQLFLAKSYGVDVSFSETESPLVDAQKAFSLAEQMVNEKKYDAATANLKLAKIKLQEYSELKGKAGNDDVKQLAKDIDNLVDQIKQNGSGSKIHALWNKATGLFEKHPSQATPTKKKT